MKLEFVLVVFWKESVVNRQENEWKPANNNDHYSMRAPHDPAKGKTGYFFNIKKRKGRIDCQRVGANTAICCSNTKARGNKANQNHWKVKLWNTFNRKRSDIKHQNIHGPNKTRVRYKSLFVFHFKNTHNPFKKTSQKWFDA